MNHARLEEMVKGWFVGDFQPSVLRTGDVEVGYKTYRKGDTEAAHFHKVATEVTLVAQGRVRMAGRTWETGSIIVLSPGDVTDFEALTDCATVVVKHPGASNDKYLA